MKVLLRTLIILAVAMLIAGATVAIAGQPGATGAPVVRREQAQGAENQGRVRPAGRRREGGREGGGLFGVAEIGRSVALMGVVIVPFALAAGLRQRARARLKTKGI
jgi:hypothetical protein